MSAGRRVYVDIMRDRVFWYGIRTSGMCEVSPALMAFSQRGIERRATRWIKSEEERIKRFNDRYRITGEQS